MDWPDYFPSDCPPESARSAAGKVYRIILDYQRKGPLLKHFQSQRESQPTRTQWNDRASECERCSISVLEDFDESLRLTKVLLDAIPANSRKKGYIAEGSLKAGYGLVLHSPNERDDLFSHHDWWKPKDVDPSVSFQFCDVVLER